jgi:hypothetical protein
VKPRYLVVLVACTKSTAPLASHVASTATPADPIACSEAQLRALAEHFPGSTIRIEVDDTADSRGAIDEHCAMSETDAACLARGRRMIPKGMVEVVDSLNTRGYIDDGMVLEQTLDVDGQIVIRWPRSMFDAMFPELKYELRGHRAKVISERRIPTPQNRRAFIWYGYQRAHREATLTFPPMSEADFGHDALLALERQLGLHSIVVSGDEVDHGPLISWQAHYTCESQDAQPIR